MSDLHGVRDIRPIEHIDGDGLFLSGCSGMHYVRAQLDEE
jgi:hypothetical protein